MHVRELSPKVGLAGPSAEIEVLHNDEGSLAAPQPTPWKCNKPSQVITWIAELTIPIYLGLLHTFMQVENEVRGFITRQNSGE